MSDPSNDDDLIGEGCNDLPPVGAPTTAPPWTPLFARATAIVTNAGGILSHCAVVMGECSIPAIVGTSCTTAMIRDGQRIEADGTSGSARIVAA